MSTKLTGWDDTIVALATPPGVGALGVIRLSGKRSFDIIKQLFPSKDLSQESSHTLHVGYLKDESKILDEAVILLFKAPRSYTGEDVIEISAHGSPFIHAEIINACISKGARLAKPGEFTQRAFLNGKLDLTQAEAVADLIRSNTEASHNMAMNNIRGGFSSILKELREQLIRFSALIELELDFSQEDVEFANREQFYKLIYEIQQVTQDLLSSFKLGNVIKNGVNVAIIGKPNAGKSTLLNAMLNEYRAIVSDIPGTTRDTIEEIINIDGVLFRLIDTAGIRILSMDTIETAGIKKSLEKMKQADLVVYLFDVHEMDIPDLRFLISDLNSNESNYLLVGNKSDSAVETDVKEKFRKIENIIFISAKEKRHLEVLKERMVDKVLQGTVNTESTIITNTRHYHALKEVEKSVSDIVKGLDEKLPGDLLALDIHRCIQFLGEITGEVSNDDMLDYIFSKFCIGK